MKTRAMKNYMGGDGVIRAADEHVVYLRRCAKMWVQEGSAFGSRSVYRRECEAQAAAIMAKADEIERMSK